MTTRDSKSATSRLSALVRRRSLLTGGVAAVGLLLVSEGISEPASAATQPATGTDLSATVSQPRAVRTFSTDFRSMHTADVGGMVVLASTSAVERGARCELSYDARVFEASAPVVMTSRRVSRVAAEFDGSGAAGRVAFAIDQPFGADDGEIGVLVPLAARRLYPAENIGPFEPPTLRVTTPDGRSTTVALADAPVASPVTPWGVEVSGAWTAIAVRESQGRTQYRVPAFVRIRSVGPAAAPAGVEVQLTFDRGVVSSCTVTEARIDGETVDHGRFASQAAFDGDELRCVLTLPDEVAAGSVVDIAVEVTGDAGARLEGIVFARVVVTGAESPGRPERATGRRMLIDVTNSGATDSVNAADGMV